MFILKDLKFQNLLHAARNYLGEISYVGNEMSTIPQELKPFLDVIGAPPFRQSQVTLDTLSALPQGNKKALFLDRDGIINVDHGYVGKVEQVDLMPGIAQLISKANHIGWDVNVVTNQSGIGRGLYTEQNYENVMVCIQRLLQHDQARLDHVEFAPFHPDSKDPKYHQGRYLRKPRPGMILKLHQSYCYNMTGSVLIGDKASDLMAGIIAGVGRVYLYESEQSEEEWHILKNWIDILKKWGMGAEFDQIQIRQLTDFSEIHY